MAVSKRLRYEILRRDNHACHYCGACAPDVVLTVDHVLAVALGGSDDPSNLAAACKDCNNGKSATPADASLVADVSRDALRWAAAMKRAAEMAEVDRSAREETERSVLGVFEGYTVPSYRGGGTLADWIPGDYFVSIEQFLKAGLTRVDLVESALIAAEATNVRADGIWRYYCGICNRKIRYLQERAADLIKSEEPPRKDPRASEGAFAAQSYFRLSGVCDRAALLEVGLA